jgi:hypothetical protein
MIMNLIGISFGQTNWSMSVRRMVDAEFDRLNDRIAPASATPIKWRVPEVDIPVVWSQ